VFSAGRQSVDQFRKTLAGFRRDPESLPCPVVHKISLVPHHNVAGPTPTPVTLSGRTVLNQKPYVSGLRPRSRPANALRFDRSFRLAQAGGVGNDDGIALEVEPDFNHVPCGARKG